MSAHSTATGFVGCATVAQILGGERPSVWVRKDRDGNSYRVEQPSRHQQVYARLVAKETSDGSRTGDNEGRRGR